MRVIAVVLWVAAACVSAVAAESYDNPFAYCAAVGTIDAPDARFSGPAIPAAVMRGLQKAIAAPPDAPPLPGVVWRCMDGKVYACTVGANLPCTAKADLNRAPAEPLRAFCKQQPDADVIPAYVTGRETVYAWRCEHGAPSIERQVADADARGFIAAIWYPIPAP